jgi:hypothetical protein
MPKIKKDTLQPVKAMIATTIGGASAPPVDIGDDGQDEGELQKPVA